MSTRARQSRVVGSAEPPLPSTSAMSARSPERYSACSRICNRSSPDLAAPWPASGPMGAGAVESSRRRQSWCRAGERGAGSGPVSHFAVAAASRPRQRSTGSRTGARSLLSMVRLTGVYGSSVADCATAPVAAAAASSAATRPQAKRTRISPDTGAPTAGPAPAPSPADLDARYRGGQVLLVRFQQDRRDIEPAKDDCAKNPEHREKPEEARHMAKLLP